MNEVERKTLEINTAIKGIATGRKIQYHLEKLIYLWTNYNDPISLHLPERRGIIVVPTDDDLLVVAKCLKEANLEVEKLAKHALELGRKAQSDGRGGCPRDR